MAMRRSIKSFAFMSASSLAFAMGFTAIAQSTNAAGLEGYEKTGETIQCLQLSQVRDSDPVDDFSILFEVNGGGVFLNELEGRCTGLEREKRFSYRSTQNKICQGDIISVTDNFGTFRGSCSLGQFQKVSKTAGE